MGIPFTEEEFSSASSDVGDISQYKPTIMFGMPGCNGKFHNPDFRITDPETAFALPGRYLARYLKNLVTLPSGYSLPD